MKKFGISGCMIVKDEEKTIEDAIRSLKIVCHEVVVVDTGSSDNTVSIAKGMGCRVLHYEWDNHFGKARNYSYSLAGYEWIFVLDGDETLSIMLQENIHDLIKTKGNVAFRFPVVDNDLPFAKGTKVGGIRLFRTGTLRYDESRKGHTQTVITSNRVVNTPFPVIHRQGAKCVIYHPEKLLNRLSIDVRDFPKDGDGFKILINGFIDSFREFFNRVVRRKGFKDGKKGMILILFRCSYRFLRSWFVALRMDYEN